MNKEHDVYWMTKAPKYIADKLISYHQVGSYWSNHPISQAWVRNSLSYYSTIMDANAWDTSLVYTGEQGELIKMSVPQARSLIRQVVTLTSKQKLAFQALAQTDSSEVSNTTKLADAVCEQIVKQQKLDLKGEKLCEQALVLGISFLKTTWRSDRGNPYAATPEGEVVYDGDVEITVCHVDDLLFDFTISEWDDLDWIEVRTIKNKWSLVSQFPELKDKIVDLQPIKNVVRAGMSEYMSVSEADLCYVYEVYHKPTPALPLGRMVVYGDSDCVFFDGPNPYGCIPVSKMCPEPIFNSGFGFPLLSYILPAQEMFDHVLSCLATNMGNLGVNNVIAPRGSNIGVEDFAGMNLMSYTPQNAANGGKPEVLKLSESNPQLFQFSTVLLENMQQMVNLNSAARGSPPAGVTAGVAIATLTANALEFLNSVSKAYQMCLEDSMMHAINAYRRFASIPKMVSITGKQNQTINKEFLGKDLDPVKAVKISVINPIMQSTAGRVDIAEKLLAQGMIKNAEDYIAILDGAPLSRMTKGVLSEVDLVELENEKMGEGQEVQALATDKHSYHINEHKTLLNDPQVRGNDQMVQIVLNHVLQHLQLEKETDPMLKAIIATGQAPMMPPGPPMGGPPMGAPPTPPDGGVGPVMGEGTNEASESSKDLLGRGE